MSYMDFEVKEILRLIASLALLILGLALEHYKVGLFAIDTNHFFNILIIIFGLLLFIDFFVTTRLRRVLDDYNFDLDRSLKKIADCFHEKKDSLNFVIQEGERYTLQREDLDGFSSYLFEKGRDYSKILYQRNKDSFEINTINYSFADQDSIMKGHYHNFEEHIHILEGKWIIKLNDEKHVLEKGDRFEVPSKIYHQVEIEKGSKAIVCWGRKVI